MRVSDQLSTGGTVARFNAKLATLITNLVGTIWCFYVFNGIALVSLPAAIKAHNMQILVNWISSNWVQLILLPALMVGQNLAAAAADKRAEATYLDAEAVLHETASVQEHLAAQDAHLIAQDDKLAGLVDQVTALIVHVTAPGS